MAIESFTEAGMPMSESDEQRRQRYFRDAWVGVNSQCPTCNGTGYDGPISTYPSQCYDCAGLGYVTEICSLIDFVRLLAEVQAKGVSN